MYRLVRVTIKPEIVTDHFYLKERHKRFIGKTFTGVKNSSENELVYINFEEPVIGGHSSFWKLLGLDPKTRNIYGFYPNSLLIEDFELPDPPDEGEWE